MKIIINADDLGKNSVVNNSIYRLLDEHKITSASIIANEEYLEQIKQKASDYPECSFGVHLYLSEFHPVTNNIALKSLINENGAFHKTKNILKGLKLNDALREGIYNELAGQIEKIISYNIHIEHINSHHHIHLIPKIIPLIKELQHKYHINKIRIKRNIYNGVNVKYAVPRLLNSWIINRYIKYSNMEAVTADKFTDLQTFVNVINKHGKKYCGNIIELSVHPGHDKYKYEMKILDELNMILPAKDIKLISYNEL